MLGLGLSKPSCLGDLAGEGVPGCEIGCLSVAIAWVEVLTASRVILLSVDLSMDAVPDALAVNFDKFPALGVVEVTSIMLAEQCLEQVFEAMSYTVDCNMLGELPEGVFERVLTGILEPGLGGDVFVGEPLLLLLLVLPGDRRVLFMASLKLPRWPHKLRLELSLESLGLANGLGKEVVIMLSEEGPLDNGSFLPGDCLMNDGLGPTSGLGNMDLCLG